MIAVVLPGRAYPVTAPALAVAVDAVREASYDVRPVTWGELAAVPPDPDRWVTDQLRGAAVDGCDLVVAKSLGTRAAAHAARQGWPAVWVTPLLRDAAVLQGIRANSAPQLLVCGGADPLHDTAAVDAVSAATDHACTVLELDGVDHALSSTDDGVVAPAVLDRVATAVAAFLRRLR